MTPAASTPFQLRVFAAVRRVPAGRVARYGQIAAAVGCGSARVIGQALRLCEDASVPCHRIVAADLTLGGFGGKSSGAPVRRKRRLLEAEGVRVGPGGRIAPEHALPDAPGTLRLLAGGEIPPARLSRTGSRATVAR